MIFRRQPTAGFVLAVIATTFSAHAAFGFPLPGKKAAAQDIPAAKLTANQNQLIDKAIVREKEVIKTVKERAPLVETYIQNMRADDKLGQTPDSDQHFLGRVEFSRIIGGSEYEVNKSTAQGSDGGKFGFFKHSTSFITGLGSSLHLNFSEVGFVQMLLMDSNDFDRQHYQFGYVRNEFLGNTPTAVFDVTPLGKDKRGRFFGRIWIETREGNVVRFNGNFAGSEKDSREYYHFDSWRTNVQPGLWLPTSFYVEESDSKSVTRTLKFKAINHIWGYVLKVPQKDSENTSMDVVGATDVSSEAQDLSPLGAQRAWVAQAEDNVVERLYQAGLLDAPSEFDKTLEALATNILAYNNITLSRPIHCRTLLTEPLESLSVGNTIILSKSLIDTTAVLSQDGAQQMGNLNALLAFQLAHIILGHRLDTKFAFNDRLLFPATSVFNRIPMHHTNADNEAAAKKAVELLGAKELVGGEQYFGLYLQQLQQRLPSLKALNQPMIGDGLVKSDNDQTFWMAAMVAKSPKLDMADLKQQAAMPLSSFLRRDPWTDQTITLHPAFETLLSPADKMPFEVGPVYIKLGYYKPPTETPAPSGGAPAANSQPAPATSPATPAEPTSPAAATANPPQN
ncbi:hypothetical protein [Edaphobacter modestus]|uniref:Uncharacterized protein n=1 Tax=Edaphobacter modestus TaxID=388466 RepID=A0A4Q7YXW2_9BACT|nr:hypothetical protein [Edaphobacter modestus]RZU42802.1 hypothetical protein BDD14_4398 [Edaphobacter modestus]